MNLIFEYLPYDLKVYLEKFGSSLSLISKRILLYQLLRAVSYLHSKTILHRDLKPCNILMTKDGIPKITDFGLGRRYQLPIGRYTHEVESLYYRAPEILLGTQEYSTGIDTWALGCIFAEIYKGSVLFQGNSEIGQLFAIFQILGTPNEEVWNGVSNLKDYKNTFPQWKAVDLKKHCPDLDSDGINLLKKMLKYDPLKRITPKQALKHRFFEDIYPSQ